MDPKITPSSINEENNQLRFTLQGVNTSIANSLRRTMLSDIDIIVFKTYTEDVNKCAITRNTTAFNNEIVKQRLGCIPIHINDLDMPIQDYILEIDVQNDGDAIQYVTTKDFKVRNIKTDTYLTENDKQNIFPPCDQTGYYIDFLRLKPRISDEIPGEAINLTCEFGVGNAKENGMFNVVSASSYACSVDEAKMEAELNKKRKEWKDIGYSVSKINDESSNWKLLDGLRNVKPDSFDFIVETIGVLTNQEIVHRACNVIISKLGDITKTITNDTLQVVPSKTTMHNSYDIILVNEDYTIGKALEFVIYTKFYESQGLLTFCGFKKEHPHDRDSIIRVAYENASNESIVRGHVQECIQDLVGIYNKIKTLV